MGIDDLVNKGKEFLKSDQVEEISDKALDGAADLAKKATPDEHDAKVDGVRDNIDKAIGNE